MKALRIPIAVLLVVVLACVGLAQAAHPKKSKFVVSATMSGNKVVANGDPDAKGKASLTFKKKKDRVCFDIDYSGMSTATRGVLGEGKKHERGDNILTLFSLSKESPAKGCLRALNKNTIDDIERRPKDFFVTLENKDHPDGAVRGQLRDRS
ncbi:MAG: hypothetical protein QOG62_55 [Thermoleophilaceae bacterium]|jgi:hypothetical protein|nr:hypothetical protein [Thermoleophilaceae bacterium]